MIGFHPDYQEQLQDLAAARDSTIEGAKLYRDYQLTSVDQRFAVETEATETEYKVSMMFEAFFIYFVNIFFRGHYGNTDSTICLSCIPLKAEREGLRDKMLAIIEAKRRALKEDNDHLDTINGTKEALSFNRWDRHTNQTIYLNIMQHRHLVGRRKNHTEKTP